MLAFNWTGSTKNVPEEYMELILCRDVYHCTPSALEAEDFDTVMTHFTLHNAEIRGKNARQKSAER